MRLLGVVLCGGRSSRMRTDKAFLRHPSGVSFLEHAAMRVRDVCTDFRLCGYQRADVEYPTLPDPIEFEGPVTGIVTALTFAQQHSFDGCLVTPLDMPNLTTNDLRKLKRVWQTAPQDLVCGVCDDVVRIQPLIAIYPARLKDQLVQLSQSDNRSLRRWIAQTEHLEVPLERSACHNVNTPEDYPT